METEEKREEIEERETGRLMKRAGGDGRERKSNNGRREYEQEREGDNVW